MQVRDWFRRVLPYLGRRQADADLQEELRLHVELERERLRGTGVPDDEADRAARRRLGNPTLIRERTRDVWGWRWLDDLGRDVRHALRGLRRNAAFTATVVCVLAAGIGANSAMFGIVHGMLIRPLPYPEPGAIVEVGEQYPGPSSSRAFLTNRTLPRLQAEAESFEQLAAYQPFSFHWSHPDGAMTLSGARVSPSLFPLLRARLRLGRLFTEADARAGAERVVLLSHGAWSRRFGSDPDIVGRVLTLNEAPHAVAGVLAEGFYFPNPESEVWTPWVLPSAAPSGSGEDRRIIISLRTLGRLRTGVSPERAAAEVQTILLRADDDFMRSVRRQDSDAAGDAPEIEAGVIPLQDALVGEYRPALLALTAAVALVLLIACSNVAGLLLARGVTRRRELALRAALGAGRGRVVRQLLTESAVLGVGGGAVGLAAATGAGRGRVVRQLLTESAVLGVGGGAVGLAAATMVLRAVPALVPGDVARLDEVGVDGVVLAFTLGLSVLVGLVFGAAPAFQWSGGGLPGTLREGDPQAAGGFRRLRSNRIQSTLAAAQAALAIVLLIGAGLLLRSFAGLVAIDRGYDPTDVIAARTRNPDLLRPGPAGALRPAGQRFSGALLEEMNGLARLPGVEAVGLSSWLPLMGGFMGTQARAADQPMPSDPNDLTVAWTQVVNPGYFDVMRLRFRSGRPFSRLDGAGSPRVVVVNETFAREVFGGAPAVGQRVRLGDDDGDEPLEVVGVVADVRYTGLLAAESSAEAYLSVHQLDASSVFTSSPFISVRTAGDPSAIVPLLREAVAAAHPRASIEDAMTMDARQSAWWFAEPRFYAVFAGSFAALALFLAASGLYGLLGYNVARRRREIGVRMALGAQRRNIIALVVRQGAALVAVGAVAGLLGAAAVSRILESFLFGVTPYDHLTFVGAPVSLAAVALVACWLPARRAARVDPMETLRAE